MTRKWLLNSWGPWKAYFRWTKGSWIHSCSRDDSQGLKSLTIKIITADLCLRLQRQCQDKKEQDADSPGEATGISGECRVVGMSSCQRSHSQRMLTTLSSLHRATPEAVGHRLNQVTFVVLMWLPIFWLASRSMYTYV